MPANRISAFIITYNEADNIAKTLDRLTWCDEIIVVDSNSTDNTVAICESYGAKVYSRPFAGFGKQKQAALELCQYEWRLSIDADEVPDDLLIKNIRAILQHPEAKRGYYLKRRQVFMGRAFRYGDESARKILRLVRGDARFTDVAVHEELLCDGEKGTLEGVMLHNSYASFEAYLTTINRYTSLNASKAFERKKSYSNLEVILKPKVQFLRKYIVNLNMLNGIEGYYWSKLSAYYVFLKCLKVREYRQQHGRQR